MAVNHESTETIELAIQKFNEKNGEIATLNSQVNTLTSTVNTLTSQVNTDNTDFGNIYEAIVIKGAAEYCDANIHSTYATAIYAIDTYSGDVDALEGYLDDVYTQIVAKGGTCTQNDYSTYDDGVASIPTSGGDTSQLEGYLSDIYTVISANTVGVTCTSGVYSSYDDAIDDIYDAYDLIISGKDSTISGLEGYLDDVYNQIVAKGGTCTQNNYSTYDDGVASIPTSGGGGGDTSQLEGYLSDIYTVISANTVGVTCTSGVYSSYDDAIDDIYDAYDATITGLQGQISTLTGQISSLQSQVSTLQSQVSSRDALIAELRGYLSDVYDAIIDMGGTDAIENNYPTYDDGILSIPSATPSGVASFDDIKSQLNMIDVPSTNLVITNGNSLFKNMTLYEKLYGGMYDLTNCTDVTDMFKNCPSLVEFKLSNFGNNVNNDLILDISDSSHTLNFADWYQDIPAYTGQYIRKIIVNQDTYDYNPNEIAALRNKNIIVEVKTT